MEVWMPLDVLMIGSERSVTIRPFPHKSATNILRIVGGQLVSDSGKVTAARLGKAIPAPMRS
jgi:hypothetical protein